MCDYIYFCPEQMCLVKNKVFSDFDVYILYVSKFRSKLIYGQSFVIESI